MSTTALTCATHSNTTLLPCLCFGAADVLLHQSVTEQACASLQQLSKVTGIPGRPACKGLPETTGQGLSARAPQTNTLLVCGMCPVLVVALLHRGVWFPNQKLDTPPSMTPAVLLSSSFAQEQYITMAAHQLVSMPGTYMLQVRTALWP